MHLGRAATQVSQAARLSARGYPFILSRVPFLPGDTDLDQLGKIFLALGTPTEKNWPGLTQLPDYIQFKPNPGTPLRDIFTAAGDDLLDLLGKMLTLCPTNRINAENALRHQYFSNKPAPSTGENLPLPASCLMTKTELKKLEKERKRKILDNNPHAKKLVFT